MSDELNNPDKRKGSVPHSVVMDEIIPWEVDTRITGLQEEIEQLRGQVAALVADLGTRDDFIQRLMDELAKHGWGDMHYTPGLPTQDEAIIALLKEGGYGNYAGN